MKKRGITAVLSVMLVFAQLFTAVPSVSYAQEIVETAAEEEVVAETVTETFAEAETSVEAESTAETSETVETVETVETSETEVAELGESIKGTGAVDVYVNDVFSSSTELWTAFVFVWQTCSGGNCKIKFVLNEDVDLGSKGLMLKNNEYHIDLNGHSLSGRYKPIKDSFNDSKYYLTEEEYNYFFGEDAKNNYSAIYVYDGASLYIENSATSADSAAELKNTSDPDAGPYVITAGKETTVEIEENASIKADHNGVYLYKANLKHAGNILLDSFNEDVNGVAMNGGACKVDMEENATIKSTSKANGVTLIKGVKNTSDTKNTVTIAKGAVLLAEGTNGAAISSEDNDSLAIDGADITVKCILTESIDSAATNLKVVAVAGKYTNLDIKNSNITLNTENYLEKNKTEVTGLSPVIVKGGSCNLKSDVIKVKNVTSITDGYAAGVDISGTSDKEDYTFVADDLDITVNGCYAYGYRAPGLKNSKLVITAEGNPDRKTLDKTVNYGICCDYSDSSKEHSYDNVSIKVYGIEKSTMYAAVVRNNAKAVFGVGTLLDFSAINGSVGAGLLLENGGTWSVPEGYEWVTVNGKIRRDPTTCEKAIVGTKLPDDPVDPDPVDPIDPPAVIQSIDKKNFAFAKSLSSKLTLDYNGQEQKAEVILKNADGIVLTEGEDYDVTYTHAKTGSVIVDAGKVTVTVTGKGAYKGTIKADYTIAPLEFAKISSPGALKCEFTEEFEYNPATVKRGYEPKFTLTYNGNVLTAGKDFKVKYSGNKAAGTADLSNKKAPKVTITGTGSFKGKAEFGFDIARRDILNDDTTYVLPDVQVSAKPGKFMSKVVVYDQGKKLKEGKDYKLQYTKTFTTLKKTDSVDSPCEIFVWIEGLGNYRGSFGNFYRVCNYVIKKPVVTLKKSVENISDISEENLDEYFEISPGKGIEAKPVGEDIEVSDFAINENKGKYTAEFTVTGCDKNFQYGGKVRVKVKLN